MRRGTLWLVAGAILLSSAVALVASYAVYAPNDGGWGGLGVAVLGGMLVVAAVLCFIVGIARRVPRMRRGLLIAVGVWSGGGVACALEWRFLLQRTDPFAMPFNLVLWPWQSVSFVGTLLGALAGGGLAWFATRGLANADATRA